MNVPMKKLLSMLLVVAMVVSMIVPVNFSVASAAETSAVPADAQAEIAKGKLVQEKSAELREAGVFSGTGEVQSICPVCYANGDTSTKTWKPITADYALTDGKIAIYLGNGSDEHGDHFYFAEDFVRDYYQAMDGMFTRSGCVNFNGKTVTLNGAKIVELYSGRTINFLDTAGTAVITGSADQYGNDGKVMRVREDGAVINLFGGTYKGMNDTYSKGSTDSKDGSATIAVRGGTLNMYEGTTIVGVDGTTGNTASIGGAVYLNNANNPVFNMYGGVIRDGKATTAGNIYMNTGSEMNMYAGRILNGASTGTDHCAGNIYVMSSAVLSVYGGEILGGSAKYGGNIYLKSASTTAYGTMNMYGGFIAGGTSTKGVNYGHNVYLGTHGSGTSTTTAAVFNMAGGTLVGYLATSPNYGGSGSTKKHTATFSGTARLVPYGVDSQGNAYSATTTLSKVTFSSANITTGGILFGGALDKAYGYCQDCKKASLAYTVVTAPVEMTAGGHYIFLGSPMDYTFATPDSGSSLLKSKGNACIDLNGANIKIHKGRFLTVNAGGIVNVRDSAGGAEIAGSFDYYTGNGRVIQTTDLSTSTSTLNLYGGTYKGFVYEGEATNGTKNATALIRVRNNATVNLYEGATVDGSSIEQKVAAVFVGNSANTPSTFNLEGGTVIGTKNASSDGDAVRLGNSANSATLNVNSGKIIGAGGIAVNVRNGSVLNVTGGSITNEKGAGVNCYLTNTISVSGGEVSTLNVTEGSTLTLSGKPVIGMLYTNGVLANVDGLSSEADITVGAGAGTVLTAATETDIGNAIKHSDEELIIKKNADGQYVVAKAFADPVEGTFDPENCGGKAYCPVCNEIQTWTAISEPTAMDGGHYYLAGNIDYNFNNDSDNNFLTGHGTINLNGFDVTINAGRFISAGAGVTNIVDTEGDAVVIGSNDRYDNNGATISVNNAEAVLNVRGGTYKGADDTLAEGATDTTTTGSVVRVRLGELNLYDGAVIDGEGYDKVGNYSLVYIGHTSGDQAFNMYGGTIKNGTSEQYGGNVYIRQGKTFNMEGGAILNGTAKQGGNVYIASTNEIGGAFHMKGGFIGGGTATSGAGNYGSNVGLQTHKNTDGTYVNNTTFSMTGGTIVGGVAVCWGQNLANKTFTITGTAKVVPEAEFEGVTYTETVGLCKISFDSSEAEKGFEVWTGQTLANTYTWCDHCDKIVKINNLYKNATPVAEMVGHYRFMEDVSYTFETQDGYSAFLKASGDAYIDLQGHDVTVTKGRFLTVDGSNLDVTIIDSVGGAEISASYDFWGGNARTIQVNGSGTILNLYGGTYKGFKYEGATTNSTAVIRLRDYATVNLYEGAVIDGRGLEQEVATIFMGNTTGRPSTFNLEGGTIYGGANTKKDGGAFRVGNGADSAILNVNSGTIVGGVASSGAAIQVRTGNTLTVNGGTIKHAEGGEGTLVGSYTEKEVGTTMNFNGGDIQGLVIASANSSVTVTGAPKIESMETRGNLINVDGITAGAHIGIVTDFDVAFTTAYTGDVDMTSVFTTELENALLKQNDEGQFYYKEKVIPKPGVFNPWECEGYAYCPICGGDEPVLWTVVTAATKMDGGHYYLADHIDDATYSGDYTGYITGSGCLNLNGKNVTFTGGGRFLFIDGSNVANVMDTEGTSVVKGSCDNGVVTSYYGATIRVNAASSVLNLYGGTYERIDDTETNKDYGVSVVGVRGGTLNIYDGATIRNGDIAKFDDARGGNLYINSANNATVNMYGGAILNGCADSGGNIFANAGATLKIEGGFIGGGIASSGGNIHLNTYSGSSAVNFTVKGDAMIVGNIRAGLAGTVMTVAGTPKILPSAEYEGVTYTASTGVTNINFAATMEQLEKGAEIWYETGFTATCVWCDHCQAMVHWTNLYGDTAPVAGLDGHYRFLEDVSYTFETQDGYSAYLKAGGEVYIDLQGHDVTVTKGRFLTVDGANMNVTIADTKGGAEISASYDFWSGNARVIQVNGKNTTLNLNGGTYKGFVYEGATSNATAIIRLRDYATVNLYEGAVIDGRDMSQKVATIFMGNGADKVCTFNVEGGTVYGGHNTNGDGGAFRVGNGVNTAILNVNSGTIIGGQTTVGDAIQIRDGNTANINGGLIAGGEGSADSLIWNYGTLNINGGVIVGEVRVEKASSQTTTPTTVLTGAPLITTEYTVGDTTYTATTGLRLVGELLADVNGLTKDARVRVACVFDVPFTTAYNGTVDMKKVFTFKDAVVLSQNADKQFLVTAPVVIIGNVAYGSVEDALAAYNIASGKAVIFLQSNVSITEDVLVDVAASAENLVISGKGTVYGFDTTNDTYESYIKITVSGDVEVAPEASANGKRYMALKEGNQYGFHRFETRLTHVTLRTTEAGLYYKAEYLCDTTVRDRVIAHGVVLSVVDMPGANFLKEGGNLYTAIEGQFKSVYTASNHTAKTTSGSVFGILKESRDPALNTQYLTMDIYANSYFLVDLDGDGDTCIFVADNANEGLKRSDEGFTGIARNLLECVEAINKPENVAKLSVSQKTNLINFANECAGYLDAAGKAKWDAATSNILA